MSRASASNSGRQSKIAPFVRPGDRDAHIGCGALILIALGAVVFHAPLRNWLTSSGSAITVIVALCFAMIFGLGAVLVAQALGYSLYRNVTVRRPQDLLRVIYALFETEDVFDWWRTIGRRPMLRIEGALVRIASDTVKPAETIGGRSNLDVYRNVWSEWAQYSTDAGNPAGKVIRAYLVEFPKWTLEEAPERFAAAVEALDPSTPGATSLARFWRTVTTAIRARTVNDIVSLESQLFSLPAEAAQEIWLNEIGGFFAYGLDAITSLKNYATAPTVEAQVAYLTKAISELQYAPLKSPSSVHHPETRFAQAVAHAWVQQLQPVLEDLQGTSRLNVSMTLPFTAPAEAVLTLPVSVLNDGRGYAEDLRIEVPAGVGFDVSKATVEPEKVALLASSQTVVFTLRLPLTEGPVRVPYTLYYRDKKGWQNCSFEEAITFRDEQQPFVPFDNPYRTGKPIKEKNSPVFYGRYDIVRDIRKILEENLRVADGKSIILLVGERRMGKTSVLAQLDHYLPADFVTAFAEMQGFNDEGDAVFLEWLGFQLKLSLDKYGIEIDPPLAEQLSGAPYLRFQKFVYGPLQQRLQGRHLVVLFDEFEVMSDLVARNKLDSGIMLFLRNLMQHAPQLSFVFGGTYSLIELASEYQSVMFNIAQIVKLDFLSEEDTRRLITEPVADKLTIGEGVPEFIYRLTHGHPFFTQLLCHSLVELQRRNQKRLVSLSDVDTASRELVKTGQSHFAYIHDQRSPVSRVLLAGVAAWSGPGRSILAAEIVSRYAAFRLRTTAGAVTKALEELVDRGILVSDTSGGENTYQFRLELVRMWVESHRRFEQELSHYGESAIPRLDTSSKKDPPMDYVINTQR